MKQKILILDIDRTLFDPDSFLEDLYKTLDIKFDIKRNDLLNIYKKCNPHGYFEPQIFSSTTSKEYSIDLSELNATIWNQEMINKNLYKDTSFVWELSKKTKIVIFSKGDYKFQRKKIEILGSIIKEENIHIYPNKIEKIPEVFSKFKDAEVIVVDDDFEVLKSIKDIDKEIFTILIDREKKIMKNDRINARIESLSSIGDYL